MYFLSLFFVINANTVLLHVLITFICKGCFIFAPMKRKIFISRILLAVTLLFTVVFHLSHLVEHFKELNAYEKEHHLHAHFNQKREQVQRNLEFTTHHDTLSDCFACDHMLNPYIGVDVLEFDVLEPRILPTAIFSKQHVFSVPLVVYFSLRAPPVFA